MAKESACSVGDAGDAGLILSSWDFPGKKKWAAAHSGVLAGKIPRTEEPGWL